MSNGTYMAAKVTDFSVKDLTKFFNKLGIVCESNLHTTILYSRVAVEVETDPKQIYLAWPKHYSLFTSNDKQNVLVIELQSDKLVKRHQDIMDTTKATYDWDEYKPHITIMYGFEGGIENLPLPDFPILLSNEYTEELNLD